MKKLPLESFTHRWCPICGSQRQIVRAEQNVDFDKLDEFAFASRKVPEYMHWRLVECTDCDLLYASPVPNTETLEAEYDEAAFDSQQEAAYASATYGRAVARIVKQLPDQVGALDIGTGDGAFLRTLLGLGFTDVVGVEPSAAPIAAASDVKPLIVRGFFEPGDFSPNRFSLISCFQTIEHVSDPAALCAGALRLLKPGGALIIVGHNRRALSAKLMGKRSPIYDIEHLQLFSPKSAKRLLEAAGFKDVSIRPVINRYPLNYWLRLMPLPGKIKGALIRMMRLIRLGEVPVPLPAGNLCVYGFRPAS